MQISKVNYLISLRGVRKVQVYLFTEMMQRD